NGHTNGTYLDDRSLDPFWERAQALDALIYLHPADPLTPAPVLDGYNGLRRAAGGWAFETGSPALGTGGRGGVGGFPPWRRVRGSRSAIWAKPCRSCSGVSTAAQGRIFTRSSSRNAPRNTSRTTSWWRPRACARRSRSTARSVRSAMTV